MHQDSALPTPATGNRWLVLVIVSVALFLIVIDMTVLYTALPRLTHDLAASAAEKLWIVNTYPLVVAGLLPGAGTLGDRLGHKRLFLAGLMVFGVASACAAYSPGAALLIASRALLAVGAAMMMPATLSIIRHTFQDDDERAFAIGVWAAVASGGAALGPVVGGLLLLEHFWWGSVFLINVPIVLLALPLAWRLIPAREGDSTRRWDLLGSLQIMVGLVSLAYAIKALGHRSPSLAAVTIATLLGCGFVLLFVRRQRRSAAPLIDFALFRNRRFSSGVAAAITASVALIGIELVFTQRLQLVLGLSPLQAAYLILPIPLAAFIAGPLAGLALKWLDPGRMMATALAVSALGTLGLMLTYAGSLGPLLASLTVLGLGLGTVITGASSAIMLNAPAERAGMAAAVEEVSYELGGAIGVALLGSVLSMVYSASLSLPIGLAVAETARDSLDEALIAAEALTPGAAAQLVTLARGAFDEAFVMVLTVVLVLLGLVSAAIAAAVSRAKLAARAGAH
ncbi:MAG: MFS transporter [Candidatus Dactylopiibacterium carminicum]|uniref:MFS transporter n=1 Tax=Candidatus Dactylopiibacterium carminicum TaxID=857335 RepID=A0A272EN89_9RHOO|nr:MFS transporter [Candidatus Dactylopiibacterium carminicum]KAF7597989.1 MFS transporter [Candidatus Dactylopiibacterium carminicum]PAS91562.1 MAG: MFS transporter [Candidatus Dactylopiibacterium carminicum]PAS93223.1 MAG: MFS transporter [Candidatus Dactylopiibacterium carminicum]PAS96241.1 MAG: MFS transporter [Candidatus Dactylopiibacterium carminicum]